MLGVICEHVGLSVARILMFRTQNTTIKIFMYYIGAREDNVTFDFCRPRRDLD